MIFRKIDENRKVSIHAPTRGATEIQNANDWSFEVSIHAPTRGATKNPPWTSNLQMFQSTHPRGVRLDNIFNTNGTASFNPRTHEGCDLICTLLKRCFMFQSTHPRGVRHLKISTISRALSFNPRTHEGCDLVNKDRVK